MSLVLRNLDTNNEIPLSKETPLVIGRGEITGCSDKRVSRKHSQISYVSDDNLLIVALHTNPCFIMIKGLPPVMQLKKNEEKILTKGDYVGLLPDASWFEIISKGDPLKNSTGDQDCGSTTLKINSPKPLTNDNSSLKLQGDAVSYCSTSEVTKYNEPSTSNVEELPKTESSHSKDVEPRSTNAISSELEKTKRLPIWMYEIDEPKEEVSAKANLNKRPHSLSAEKVQGKKAKVGTALSSDDQKQSRESIADELEPGEVKVKEENMEVTSDTVEVKSELGNSQKSSLPAKESNESEKVAEAAESKMSGESSKKSNEKDGYESDVVEPDGSNETNDPPRRRPICQYEASCYRKNPVHKQEYCHPGDADYVRLENRPQCPYGAACYRQNQLHRVEYQHPTSTPAPRPQPQSPTSPASPLPPKRKPKTTKTKARSSSVEEDDYDLEDPFLNDASSDDYAPSESSSEDEEEEEDDSSQNDQENLKRLRKEAKKFTNNKKNK